MSLVLLIALSSLYLFSLREKNSTPSSFNDLPARGESAGLDVDKPALTSAPGTETSKPNESEVVSIVASPASDSGGAASYSNLSVALAQNVLAEGISQEVADCLVSASRDNLKLEKPLDFDGITDSCALKYQLSNDQKTALKKAFRDSVRQISGYIELDKWKSCMMEKHKNPGCITESVLKNVEAFYLEHSGSAPMKNDAFQNARQSEIENILNDVMNKCPEKINDLNGIYANECT